MTVSINWQDNALKPQEKRIMKIIKKTLKMLNMPSGTEVSVLITTDGNIKKLNNKYRGIKKATDILSFPQKTNNSVLGDIVISADTLKRNARRLKHSLDKELKWIIVHGLLHLTGYDHKTNKERTEMRTEERKIICSL